MLLAAFLWLERVPRERRGPAPPSRSAVPSPSAWSAAPALDRPQAWVDYEQIAESFAPAASVSFDFSHRYGPLDWPRDGREVLRVKAQAPGLLEGGEPRRLRRPSLACVDRARARAHAARQRAAAPTSSIVAQWRQRIEVTIRSLDSTRSIGAGTTLDVVHPPSAPVATASPGTYAFEETLKRGDSYAADVYVPRPVAARQMAAAPAPPTRSSRRRYFALTRPDGRQRAAGRASGGGRCSLPRLRQRWVPRPSSRRRRPDRPQSATPTMREQSVYAAHVGPGASGSRARSRTPYEYVRRVLALPAPTASPTPSARCAKRCRWRPSCSTTASGYCQQFSGAMALLLRMGGVPARVAGGFSPGSFTAKRARLRRARPRRPLLGRGVVPRASAG